MQVLEEKKLWDNFYNSLRSPVTKQVYVANLKQFMKYHHIEVKEKIEESHFVSLLENPEDKIKDYVISIQGSSESRFKVLFAALKNFYEMNDIELRWKKLKRFCGEPKAKHEDRAYTHEEIHLMVSNANIKLKAAILLMSSSGMRIGALPLLATGSIAGNSYSAVTVYANTNYKYITFITPECRKAIDSYLDFRRRCGEKIDSNSPLFRKDFDTEDLGQARNEVREWTIPAIKGSIHRLMVMIGLRIEDHVSRVNRKEVKLSHGFRKFFETQLINSDVKEGVVKKLMGHADDLTSRYYKPTEEYLYGEYTKAIDLLTIDPSKRLQRKVEMLTVEKSKIDLALSEIAEMKKMISRKAS